MAYGAQAGALVKGRGGNKCAVSLHASSGS
jgi:hypothetical protein